MTNPPQGGDPANWARPTQATPQPPQPTERIPRQEYPPTEQIASQGRPVDPATQYIPQQGGTAPGPAGPPPPAPEDKPERSFRDPLSIVLILVIVGALAIAGVLGGELYARHRADSIVSKVVACVVQDQASASFGVVPPFLWQHLNKRYTNISIETAGNQVREAKGMKVKIDLDDVHLEQTASAAGTIGSLTATIDWSAEGIKQTVQGAIPLFGGIVSSVSTNPSDGTIDLQGALGSVIARPTVVDNGLSLEVLSVSGLGITLPRETVQPALDVFTGQLTKNYPLGIHADNVKVTDTGVTSQFSTQNATIPVGNEDPCFAGL